jgi:hypothetical protein
LVDAFGIFLSGLLDDPTERIDRLPIQAPEQTLPPATIPTAHYKLTA